MPTREEMIRDIQSSQSQSSDMPSREQMMKDIATHQGQPQEDSSLGEKAFGLLGKVGSFVDSYTGAPTRSALGALQEGKSTLGAFVDQFGKNPELAPTGKQLAQRQGISDKPLIDPSQLPDLETDPEAYKMAYPLTQISRSGLAGFGVDALADPLNLIPVVGAAKKALQGSELLAKGAQVAGKSVEAGKGLLKSAALRTGEALTGVPRETINTYATQTKEVNDLIKRFGTDTASSADEIRSNLQNKIKQTRSGLGNQISETLKTSSPEKSIDISPVIDQLEKSKSKLNPNLKEDAVNQIDKIIEKVKNEATDGKVNLQSLYELGSFLQDKAKSAYHSGGQIFLTAPDAAKAAKGGAAVARKSLNELAPPIREANNQFYQLHRFEDDLTNKNLITPGKAEAGLISAANGTNPRNAKLLNRLGALTDTTPLEDAKKLAAQKVFAQPSYATLDFTGKGVERSAKGAALGGLLGHVTGVGSIPGAIAGGLLTSPGALKAAIQAGQISAEAATKLINAGLFLPEMGAKAVKNPVGRGLLQGARLNSSQRIEKK